MCLLQSYHGADGKIHPEREELSQLLGVTVGTIDRWNRTLAEQGLVQWRRGHTGRGNDYQVNVEPLRVSKKQNAKDIKDDYRRYKTCSCQTIIKPIFPGTHSLLLSCIMQPTADRTSLPVGGGRFRGRLDNRTIIAPSNRSRLSCREKYQA